MMPLRLLVFSAVALAGARASQLRGPPTWHPRLQRVRLGDGNPGLEKKPSPTRATSHDAEPLAFFQVLSERARAPAGAPQHCPCPAAAPIGVQQPPGPADPLPALPPVPAVPEGLVQSAATASGPPAGMALQPATTQASGPGGAFFQPAGEAVSGPQPGMAFVDVGRQQAMLPQLPMAPMPPGLPPAPQGLMQTDQSPPAQIASFHGPGTATLVLNPYDAKQQEALRQQRMQSQMQTQREQAMAQQEAMQQQLAMQQQAMLLQAQQRQMEGMRQQQAQQQAQLQAQVQEQERVQQELQSGQQQLESLREQEARVQEQMREQALQAQPAYLGRQPQALVQGPMLPQQVPYLGPLTPESMMQLNGQLPQMPLVGQLPPMSLPGQLPPMGPAGLQQPLGSLALPQLDAAVAPMGAPMLMNPGQLMQVAPAMYR